MKQVTDYKKIAKKKELEIEIVDLNRAREQVLKELELLDVKLGDRVMTGGRVDLEIIESELKNIDHQQQVTKEQLLQSQIKDLLNQAKEGSRYIALTRKLESKPTWVQEINLQPLQEKQNLYQKKQLEIFDYLEKHFSQFEAMELKAALPEAGKRFFQQVVASMAERMRSLIKQGRDLQSQLGQETRKLEKLKRQEQRALEKIHAEIGKNLTDDEVGSLALVNENQEYQALLEEIRMAEIFKASLLNQANNLIDEGIDFLQTIKVNLESIVGQNQVTREIINQLKVEGHQTTTQKILTAVEGMLQDFDKQVVEVLMSEIQRRYDEGELKTEQIKDVNSLFDEVLEFQEYLGQIFGDSLQVVTSNLDDLWQERAEYGREVLAFLSE